MQGCFSKDIHTFLYTYLPLDTGLLSITENIFGLVSCRFQPDCFETCHFTKKTDFSTNKKLALQFSSWWQLTKTPVSTPFGFVYSFFTVITVTAVEMEPVSSVNANKQKQIKSLFGVFQQTKQLFNSFLFKSAQCNIIKTCFSPCSRHSSPHLRSCSILRKA